jgi:DNA-binding response OmpR family regulator
VHLFRIAGLLWPIAHIEPAFVATSCVGQWIDLDGAVVATVLELHERPDTLTRYCKVLHSLGVESHALSVACAAANSRNLDGYAVVMLVAAPQCEGPSPALRPLLARAPAIPVLALVNAVQHARHVEWFDCGAHTLVRTPVVTSTLAQQIRALLRLAPQQQPTTACLASGLTRIERRVLDLLASQPGRPFSRVAILGHIYDDHRVVCERTVDAHVKNLRRKLTAAPDGAVVRAVYGEGYVFESGPRVT